MTNRFFYLITSCLLILISCNKEDSTKDFNQKDMGDIFNEFWKVVHNNYMYWDEDQTNWPGIYLEYKDKFKNLNANNSNDLRKSVELFRKMTSNLKDGHFSITFEEEAIKDSIILPVIDNKKDFTNFVYDYNYFIRNYLDKGYVYGLDFLQSKQSTTTAIAGLIDSDILYFRCNQFYLYSSYTSMNENGVKNVLKHFNSVLENSKNNLRGVIFDLRNNTGGNVNDLNFLLTKFVRNDIDWSYLRYKASGNPLHYTPWIPVRLKANDKAFPLIKIVCITNNKTMSIAELISLAIANLPQGKILGEKTFGATGIISEEKGMYGGRFNIGNFMNVEMSSSAVKGKNNDLYEGKGIVPNFFVKYMGDKSDEQLDAAIGYLKNN